MAGIPPGCTSLIQICDLIANKPIKQAFKKRYMSWKIASDPGPGGKYKVDRKDVLSWLEQAIEDVNAHMSSGSEVAKAFATYGKDFVRIALSWLRTWQNTKRMVFIERLSAISNRWTWNKAFPASFEF